MKYRNVKTAGYDSKKEAKRGAELKLLLRAGEISDLREQVRFEVIPKNPPERAAHYIADFVYIDKDGLQTVEDVKGFKTADYILKRKLMLHVHGIAVIEI